MSNNKTGIWIYDNPLKVISIAALSMVFLLAVGFIWGLQSADTWDHPYNVHLTLGEIDPETGCHPIIREINLDEQFLPALYSATHSDRPGDGPAEVLLTAACPGELPYYVFDWLNIPENYLGTNIVNPVSNILLIPPSPGAPAQ